MKRLASMLILIVVLIAMPASAMARPELSLTRADRLAKGAVARDVTQENDEIAKAKELTEAIDAGEGRAPESAIDPTIVGYALYPCDRESRFRALCDATYNWSDGISCDESLEVIESNPTGHHEHLGIRWIKPGDVEEGCY